MLELECIICSHPFNSSKNLPRILHCGHTICSQCLGTILESAKSCPTCRQETTNDNISDYVVNYIVVDLCESTYELMNAKENFIQLYHEKLLIRQEEHEEFRTTLESLKDNIDLNLGLVKSNEEQLTSMLDACNPFNRDSGREIKEVDERFDNIRAQVQPCYSNLISHVSLKSKDFISADQYLQKLHEMIVVENKKVVALSRIDGVPQVAKLSFINEHLFINALERSQVINDTATTVCFQDLQDILLRSGKAKSIFGFLDLFYSEGSLSRKVVIEINPSTSDLGSQFLKLCTGELGISYKGREYDQICGGTTSLVNGINVSTAWIIRLRNMNWNMKAVDNFSAYYLKKKENTMLCLQQRHYLLFNLDGSFDIFRFNDRYSEMNWKNIVGSIVDKENNFGSTFKDASFRKIANCGIAIKF